MNWTLEWDFEFLGMGLEHLITILSILVLAIVLNRLSTWLLNRSFYKASKKLKVDPTRYRFFKHSLTALIWVIAIGAIIYTIPAWRTFAITMFAGAGVLVAIIGFAGQQAFANIISGVFIVIFRPFRVGDLVKIGEQEFGYVMDITLRHVVIKDFNNRRIIVPNSVMSNEKIINHDIDDDKHCLFFVMGISYDSDVDKAMEIMAEEAEKHPFLIDNRTKAEITSGEPKVRIKLQDFGDSSVNLRAWCWAKNFDDAIAMKWDLYKSVKKRFENEGIEIPFPHRTLVFKNSPTENEK